MVTGAFASPEARTTIAASEDTGNALLADIALAFAAKGDFDARMDGALAAIGRQLGVSRAYVFLDDEDGSTTSNSHEWCAEGVAPQREELQGIPYSSIPSWRRLLDGEGRIFSTDVSTLPADLRAALEPQGIRSILVYPLLIDGERRGFIGFDECSRERDWSPAEFELLRAASGIVSTALERRISLARLQASERDFRRFFDTVDDLILVGDLEGRILYANEAVTRKLGFPAEELGGMAILDLHPEDRREEAARILGAMFRKERDTCPLELRRREGGRLPVETRVWFGSWGGRDCIYGICKDLSVEQEALQRFQKLFEANPALMAITGMEDGKFRDVNAAFLRKLGYRREEVIGRTSGELSVFVDPAQRRHVAEELERTGSIREVEIMIRRKDGGVLDGLFSGEVIETQGADYFLTVMVDISDQAELRRRLEDQRRRLRNIIDGTRLGTWEWNVRTGETAFNERWAGIVGYTLAELEPVSIKTWERLAHPADLEESGRLLERHFAGETEFYEFESRMRHKDGRWVWVLDRGKVVERDADGRPLRMFGTHADITEKREMQAKIEELAIRDPLTEVYNRRHVFARLEEIASEYARRGRDFCVSILDIDHFKSINDRFGHQAGDHALKEFSALVASSVRPYDLVGRYGGEEFIIVSPGADAVDTAAMIGRIMERVRGRDFAHEGVEIRFTFSCGIAGGAEWDRDAISVSRMVEAADRRLYRAKEAGRDRLVGPGGEIA